MPERRPVLSVLVAGLLAAGTLSACTGHDAAPPPGDGPPAAVVQQIQRALHQRARAVRHHDVGAFTAGLAPRRTFREAQRTLFDNLDQLPLSRFDYRLDAGDVARAEDGWWVAVRERTMLEGYDAAPATALDRYLFVPGRRPGRMLLASTTDAAWERANRVLPQPWEQGPLLVREAPGVLGVFDDASVDRADGLLDAAAAAVTEVADDVPYAWPGSVVLYALSDPRFLTTLPDLPGDDPEGLDAVAFPVRARPGSDRLVGTRVVLNPRVVGRDDAERDRLLRHEVTHVAVGEHDDGVPVWLSEGLAEHVSVQPMPLSAWRVAPAALAAAEAGPGALPADETFNDADSAAHYGLAWWACEYIARTDGDAALWGLVDALHEAAQRTGGGPLEGRAVDRVLQERLGLDRAALAEQAARLLRENFEPA